MIRFNVGGLYLETPENLSLTFKKTNILFAFDKIECERSTSFDIPATPQNDRIFEISKWLQTDGAGMRRRYAAQMQDAMLTKDGYLYVDAYANGKYKAVFITGELLGLKAIKNAGKIADIINPSEYTTFGTVSSPQNVRTSVYATPDYKNGETPLPSARLYTIIDRAMAQLGVSWLAPASPQYVRIIPDEAKGVKETTSEFTGTAYGTTTTTRSLWYSGYVTEFGNLLTVRSAYVRRTLTYATPSQNVTYFGIMQQFEVLQNMSITFPDNWDDNLFIGYFVNGDSNLIGEFSFYGNRSFDEYGDITGDSLRGRTVELNRGDFFTIIDKSFYVNEQTSGGGQMTGWVSNLVSCEFTVEGGEMTAQSRIRLKDNLPDVTVTELLKIYAALSGTQLYYTDAQGVTFDTLDFDTWSVLELTDVVDIKEIRRTFADYAQRNIVQFKETSVVPEYMRLRVEYIINNNNIGAERVLQEIPFSEGASAGAQGIGQIIYLPIGTAGLANADVPTYVQGGVYMIRPQLLKNAGVQSLCDASTSAQMRVRMTLLEFEQISPKTLLYYNGVRYVWTDAQWSKGTATLKLSKI